MKLKPKQGLGQSERMLSTWPEECILFRILINEVTEMMDVPGIFLLHLTRNLNFADKLPVNLNPNLTLTISTHWITYSNFLSFVLFSIPYGLTPTHLP